jgi:hypothetical protein
MDESLRWVKVRVFEAPSKRKHRDGEQATNYYRYYLRNDGLAHVEMFGTLCANTGEYAPWRANVFAKCNELKAEHSVPRSMVLKQFTEEEFDRDFEVDMLKRLGREIVAQAV